MNHIDESRNILIAGLTAAGKTTHAKLLAREYGLQYVSASTIMLRLAGLPAKQPLDFWVTPEGRQLSESMPWIKVDDECRRIETDCRDTVFDTWCMPWLYTRPCMAIWLESSLESRIMKAHVSHHGQSKLPDDEVRRKLQEKDQHARRNLLENYGVDLFADHTPFHLIVDISSFITEPTQAASEISIRDAHEIITSAVGWYLYGRQQCKHRLLACISWYGAKVVSRFPSATIQLEKSK